MSPQPHNPSGQVQGAPSKARTDVKPGAEALGDDLLYGAGPIAEFLFGSACHRRKIYYLASESEGGFPHFKIGTVICAQKSQLLAWIESRTINALPRPSASKP